MTLLIINPSLIQHSEMDDGTCLVWLLFPASRYRGAVKSQRHTSQTTSRVLLAINKAEYQYTR